MRVALAILIALTATSASAMPCTTAGMFAMQVTILRERGWPLERALIEAERQAKGNQFEEEGMPEKRAIIQDVFAHPEITDFTMRARHELKCRRAAQDALLRD